MVVGCYEGLGDLVVGWVGDMVVVENLVGLEGY